MAATTGFIAGAFARLSVIERLQKGELSRAAARIMLEAAQRNHPTKTGKTAKRLRVHATSMPFGLRLELRGSLLSRFLITGTRPHMIGKYSEGLLHWTGGKYGPGDHFARVVHHPGTKKRDWRSRAVHAARPQIIALGLSESRYLIHDLAKEMKAG